MELVDDEDIVTMVALYCGNQSDQNAPIQLFSELVGVEPTEDLTLLVSISYVDSQSTLHGIDIDLNVTPDNNVIGNDGYDSSDPCDHKVNSDSDPEVDEVPNDIDDEGVNDDGNINVSSIRNQIRHIVIHNNLEAHMWLNAEHATEYLEYPEILPTYRLAVDFDPEELFMGHIFKSKEECIFSIK
ncbi:hypothetical protein GOBAR_AA05948 [Gossypium barbadense]|uniref:Uncharacterized protein n=1 Tax=Gossypium barbadense TaxID=3634 RepID=A0A2P5YGB9_GOSBA|nr:hypothetical protein GOBAR_AA05948 [Gossypium barbadense]